MTETEITLTTMRVTVCSLCVEGEAGECHTPGCMFFICPAPDEEQAERFRNQLELHALDGDA